MDTIFKKIIYALGLLALPLASHAAIITFDFTGRLVVAGPDGTIAGPAYTPLSASLTYNTVSGFGSSPLSITMDDPYFGAGATFHDISWTYQAGNLVNAQILVDWNENYNMPLHIEWDVTGLVNALGYSGGLQVGDILSGTNLYRDTNGNGIGEAGEWLADIYSATPYSDSLQFLDVNRQGPAPLAATSGSLGLLSGPFTGIRGYIDIGSGNSMYVTSVSAVPIPAAVWLFGSGLFGLIGIAYRKKR